jgi:hypothetical protein
MAECADLRPSAPTGVRCSLAFEAGGKPRVVNSKRQRDRNTNEKGRGDAPAGSAPRRMFMLHRSSIGAAAAAATLMGTLCAAQAFDDSKYPNFKGQWERVGSPNWVAVAGPAPLTPEYQAIYQANRKDLEAGGVGDVPSTFCYPQGMPMMMNIYDPMELIVTPEITYLLISHVNDSYRRIYTDGRDWPKDPELTYAGYSIGHWVDQDGDGKFDVLEVETRDFKGPRAYDASGLPLDRDNESVIKERIYLDKSDAKSLHDEITVEDHALTHPWTVLKTYTRNADPKHVVREDVCAENNPWVKIGDQPYYLSADGKLMPSKPNQPPPDLRYFKQQTKN